MNVIKKSNLLHFTTKILNIWSIKINELKSKLHLNKIKRFVQLELKLRKHKSKNEK